MSSKLCSRTPNSQKQGSWLRCQLVRNQLKMAQYWSPPHGGFHRMRALLNAQRILHSQLLQERLSISSPTTAKATFDVFGERTPRKTDERHFSFRLQLAKGTSPCEPEMRKKGMHAAFHLRLVKLCVTLDQLASQRDQERGIPRRPVRRKSRPGELLLRDPQGRFATWR